MSNALTLGLGAVLTSMLVTFMAGAAESTGTADNLEGFSSRTAAVEKELERRFDAELSPADLRSWMEQMSSAPNHVGSAHDKANAHFILDKFRESQRRSNVAPVLAPPRT